MKHAKTGDTVKVHYKVCLENGEIIDTSVGKKPLEFIVGQGERNLLFENAIIGMQVGETKKNNIPPEQAYGPYREDLVFTTDISKIPKKITPKVGMVLQMQAADNKQIDLTITDITETTVTLNGNHPYAGVTLIYDLQLIEIK